MTDKSNDRERLAALLKAAWGSTVNRISAEIRSSLNRERIREREHSTVSQYVYMAEELLRAGVTLPSEDTELTDAKSLKDEITSVINLASVTDDCSGKWDLDFPILRASTRGWQDNTCKARFFAGDTEILSSDYISGESKEDCATKARNWYKNNLEKALALCHGESVE